MDTVKNDQNRAAASYEQCPRCGAQIPVNKRYTAWCDQCGWNIKPYRGTEKATAFQKIYDVLGQKFSKRMFDDVTAMGNTPKRFSISKLLAYIMAAAVHFVSLFFLTYGLVMIINAGTIFIQYLIGVFLLGMGWVALPRFPKITGKVVKREEAPLLYSVVDEAAKVIGTKPIDGIVINEKYNAAFSRTGILGRRIMYIGLPLFSILNEEERTALIGHELAHGVNGDSSRGIFIGTAMDTLYNWYEFFIPNSAVLRRTASRVAILTFITDAVMYVISRIFWCLAWLMLQLTWHTKQKAEYLADRLGASVSGTDAYISLLEKLHYSDTYIITVQQTALSGGKTSFFSNLLYNINSIPERELERLKRVEELENSRLDTTHPPTVYRIKYINQFNFRGCRVDLSLMKDLDEETAKFHESIQYKLIDNYRAYLY